MMTMSNYHNPVMLQECIEALNINPDGIYVDVTFGGGGHSKAIVEQLNNGKLYAFDRDQEALQNAESFNKNKFQLINANFKYIKNQLRFFGVRKVDGILADLGVSSHQFDEGKRGFSIRFDGPLDMRMDTSSNITAADIINTYSAENLQKIFGRYGEVKNAKTLALEIERKRLNNKITTIEQFKEAIQEVIPAFNENKYLAKIFQALRIEVNGELNAIEELMLQSAEILNTNGRLVVMSYHSLEDKIVKNYIKNGVLYGEAEKDFYGNVSKPFEAVNRKPIIATIEELEQNNRARSAKLRIAEKI